MVLYGPTQKIGVVSHFSGSMGKELDRAGADVLEILREVCPISPGLWKGWVFGGISLKEKLDIRDTVATMTIPLIDRIRETLRRNPYIPVNLPLLARQLASPKQQFMMKPNKIYTAKEMNLLKPQDYEGHRGVKLNLATGAVAWIE